MCAYPAGVKVDQLAEALSNIAPRCDIGSAVVHVGTNDCASSNDVDSVLQDFQHLIPVVRRVFPSALVAYTAILPQGRCQLQTIRSLNQRLAMLCEREKVSFLQENNLYTPAGLVATSLFNSDRLHLNERGAGVLLRQIKRFLSPADNLKDLNRHRDLQHARHTEPEANTSGPPCRPPTNLNHDEMRDSTRQMSNALPSRSVESATSTMVASIGDYVNAGRNLGVPVSSSQSGVNTIARVPVELSGPDTTLADAASAAHLQPPFSRQRPDYTEAATDPSYHYQPSLYGHYARPVVPWRSHRTVSKYQCRSTQRHSSQRSSQPYSRSHFPFPTGSIRT